MTHPMVPSREQLKKWEDAWFYETEHADVLLIQAFQAGADQELEACCIALTQDVLGTSLYEGDRTDASWRELASIVASKLRTARRPKPQSLNSIALQMLGTIERDAHYLPEITDTIRRALEALDD